MVKSFFKVCKSISTGPPKTHPAYYLGSGSKTRLHPRSQKSDGVVLVPKKASEVPSNSHAGGVLSGAPDTKSYVKNATYPHSAHYLLLFSLGRTTGGGQVSQYLERGCRAPQISAGMHGAS
jgi:hypothetical protein